MDGSDEEEDEEGEATCKKKKPEPKNKSELFAAYSGQGPVKMVQDFMSTRRLFRVAHIILIVSGPLEREFYDDQKAQRERGFVEWSAHRARSNQHWWGTAVEILHTMFSAELPEKMGLPEPLPGREPAANQAGLAEELQELDKAFAFACHLAGNHAWANMQYQYVLPHAMPAYLIKDDRGRRRGVARLESIIKSVCAAEREIKRQGQKAPKKLLQMMNDLAWNRQQLARDCMAHAAQTDFMPGAARPRKLAKKLVEASHSTWGVMESTFAQLRSKGKFMSKASKMSDNTKYALTITCPYAEESGLRPVKPSEKDWLKAWAPEQNKVRQQLMQSLTCVNSVQMPNPALQDAASIAANSKGWKKAGPLSQQHAAAATAYCVSSCRDGWQGISQAWSCHLVGVEAY